MATAWFGKDPRLTPKATLHLSEDKKFTGLDVTSLGMNSRDRAVLEIIHIYTNETNKNKTKILIAEPFSTLAMNIRGRYPYSISSGYLPDNPASLYPIPHIDLQRIDLPDNSLDMLVTVEVFEHLTDYHSALSEIHRVLRPGGVHLFTCPFYWNT